MIELFTIGAYGYEEGSFFEALTASSIDTFCDIRRRRGMRGSEYAFANSQRLQDALAARRIRYLHVLELAPSSEIRAEEAARDKEQGVAKRSRAGLSDAFVAAFEAECLSSFDTSRFLEKLGPDARRVILFCVERSPAACHRSVAAARIEKDLGISAVHLTP